MISQIRRVSQPITLQIKRNSCNRVLAFKNVVFQSIFSHYSCKPDWDA